MNQELSTVGNVAAQVAAISINTVCADVEIRQGEGNLVEVQAQTPGFWNVLDDGTITEVGGPVAEALKAAGDTGGSGGISIVNNVTVIGRLVMSSSFTSKCVGTGFVNGKFQVNGENVEVPDPREQLVIYLPKDFAGGVNINARYFGKISITASLRGKLDARVSSRVTLTTGDQKELTGASLKAVSGASLTAGDLNAGQGEVVVKAQNSGSSATVGAIQAGEATLKAEGGAQLNGKDVTTTGDADIRAENSGSVVNVGEVKAGGEATLKGESGGKVNGKDVTAAGTAEIRAQNSGTSVTAGKVTATGVTIRAESGARAGSGDVVCTGDVDCRSENSSSSVEAGHVCGSSLTARASSGGRINGLTVRCTGSATLRAENSSSRVAFTSVSATEVESRTVSGGRVVGKTVAVRNKATLKSDNSGSYVNFEDLWAEALEANCGMGGSVDLGNADVVTLLAKADMSSAVTIANGSAESGQAKAGMSGKVSLTGDFGAIKGKEDMGGKVRVNVVKGDAADRFLRAAKRGYNRDLWTDTFSSMLALAMVSSLAPALKENLAEALSDDTFIGLACKAIGPTLHDAAYLEALRKCGAAFGEAVGPVENLNDKDRVVSAIQSPAVSGLYTPALQLFLTTTFAKVQALAK